jgi:hypothetical protein
MKSILTTLFVAVALLIAACNNKGSKNEDKSTAADDHSSASAAVSQDSIALTKLVRQLYKWYESNGVKLLDFDPKMDFGDTLYRGINWDLHNKKVKTLAETNYFDKQFLNNYQQIAQYLDTALKSGRERWHHDELPSFGYDGSPWCNCQDTPSENYYDLLGVTDLKIENGHADFSWTWGEGFKYKTKASKENGAWKISYLDGFNPENFKSNP